MEIIQQALVNFGEMRLINSVTTKDFLVVKTERKRQVKQSFMLIQEV
jgi:hypothetical protein